AGVQAQIVSTEPRFPGEILVALNDRDPKVHDVWRIKLADGSRTLEATNPGDAIGWLADHDFKIGLHKAMTPEGGTVLRVRDAASFEIDRLKWQVLDPALKADFSAMAALQGDVTIVSRNDADTVWYLLNNKPDRSPAFLRWNRVGRIASPLFETRPRLAPYAL